MVVSVETGTLKVLEIVIGSPYQKVAQTDLDLRRQTTVGCPVEDTLRRQEDLVEDTARVLPFSAALPVCRHGRRDTSDGSTVDGGKRRSVVTHSVLFDHQCSPLRPPSGRPSVRTKWWTTGRLTEIRLL